MNQPIVFLGYPGSGKTTFLAALWHLITSRELESELRYIRALGSTEYLDGLAERWRRREELKRTSTQDEGLIEFELEARGHRFGIQFPDLSGERLDQLVEQRFIDTDLVKLIGESSAIVVFLTADKTADSMSVEDMESIVGSSPASVAPNTVPWTAELIPMQSRLVELLRNVIELVGKRKRLAVVISAWDVVAHVASPSSWLQVELPLLHQFIQNNTLQADVRVFGVSALGSSLNLNLDQMLEREPSDWLSCVVDQEDGVKSSSDIARPILWAMDDATS